MNKTLFKSAFVELVKENDELFIRINNVINIPIESKQFIELLEIVDKENETTKFTQISKRHEILMNKDCILTERGLEIVHLIAKGYNNKEIADALEISLNTVKTHIKEIFKKLNVENRTQAALKINNEENHLMLKPALNVEYSLRKHFVNGKTPEDFIDMVALGVGIDKICAKFKISYIESLMSGKNF